MCAICEHRPKVAGGRYCAQCQAKLDKDARQRKAEQPVKFATYKGHVVGFYRIGKNGSLEPRLLRRSPDGLPKGKTINLNVYCPGYTREVIKKIKQAILQLANC